MPEKKEALIGHYEKQRATLTAAISGLTDAQMSEPTIDGWSVKDHLLHIALWDELRAEEVERISAGYGTAWKMTGPQDDAFNAMAHDMRVGLSVAQAKWEFDRAHKQLLAAIAAATPRGLERERYGEAGLVSNHETEHSGWIKRWRSERGY